MGLKDLLLDVSNCDVSELENLARGIYSRLYLDGKTCGKMAGHDGQEVFFWADRFDHAFYVSADRTRRQYAKDRLSVERVARIKWIREIIAGNVQGTACWEKVDFSGSIRSIRRFYIYSEDCYMVWLEQRSVGGWKFSSAYVAQPRDLRRYCERARKIWENKKVP